MIDKMPYRPLWYWIIGHRRWYCALGIHIPVRADWPDGKKEYMCQECLKPQTKSDHLKFFGR